MSDHDFTLGPNTLRVMRAFHDRFDGMFPMIVGGIWLFGKRARFRPIMQMQVIIGHVEPVVRSAIRALFNETAGMTISERDGGAITLKIDENSETFRVDITMRNYMTVNIYTTCDGVFTPLHAILRWNSTEGSRPRPPIISIPCSKVSLITKVVVLNSDNGDEPGFSNIREICAEAGFAVRARAFIAPSITVTALSSEFIPYEPEHDRMATAARTVAASICGYKEFVRNEPYVADRDFATYMSAGDRQFVVSHITAHRPRAPAKRRRVNP